jgi:hypothetical protein
MPVVLLVVIAVAWIAILTPGWLRRRQSGPDGISSISHFHQQLRVLESSSPAPIVAPAYRLHSIGDRRVAPVEEEGREPDARPVLTVVGAKDLPRPALAFLGQDGSETRGPAPSTARAATPERVLGGEPGRSSRTAPPPVSDPLARQQALRRRRDILGGLVLVFVLTMLAGFIPGASMLWVLTALSGVALAAYVALLVQLRRRAEERERKLHYLGPPPADLFEYEESFPAVSGRYAHPSSGAVAAR